MCKRALFAQCIKAGLTFVISYGFIQITIPVLKVPTFTSGVIMNNIFIKLLFIARIPIFVCYIRNHYSGNYISLFSSIDTSYCIQ
jgi:hypothetical protein